MQNEKYSEEYYKMKYYKYRAKYEQLKEFAEQQLNEQNGGGEWIKNPFASKQQQQQQLPAQGQQLPAQGQQPPAQGQQSLTSKLGLMFTNSPEAQAKADQAKQNQLNAAKDLMLKVKNFLTEGMPEGKEKWKIIGKLEQPCTYKQLEDMVNKVKIDEELPHKIYSSKTADKNKLLADIKKTCSTTMGNLNALCVYKDDNQSGGYSDSPSSLDDLSTEF